MNNLDQYTKYVYHHIHGDLYQCGDNDFHITFPRVHLLFVHDHATKVDILYLDKIPTTIWKDKHGNIIVRMLRPFKQLKIHY